MPINYFIDRPEESRHPECIQQGDIVMIIPKEKQGSRDVKDLITGKVNRVLSHGDRYENGVKVEIILHPSDWRFKEQGYVSYIGRVQYILKKVNNF